MRRLPNRGAASPPAGCAVERAFTTCAERLEMESCPKLNNFVSRLYALIFRSRRMDSPREIRDDGLDVFVARRSAG